MQNVGVSINNDYSTEISMFFSAIVVNMIINSNFMEASTAFDGKQN